MPRFRWMKWPFLCWTVLGLCVAAASAGESRELKEATDTIPSGNEAVTVWRFEPTTAGKHPAVLLLHGVDGVTDDNRDSYRTVARRLATKGYVVLFVHYFERTQTQGQALKAIQEDLQCYLAGSCSAQQLKFLEDHFKAWTAAVCDAVAYARKLPGVDGERVALAGFSLGGYLAVSAAMIEDLHIAAVVELFGGLPPQTWRSIKRLPPILILHGDRDQMVPVREAYALHGLLTTKKLPSEIVIYEEVGHMFAGPNQGPVCGFAALDAERRATAFLNKHLGEADRLAVPPCRTAAAGRP